MGFGSIDWVLCYFTTIDTPCVKIAYKFNNNVSIKLNENGKGQFNVQFKNKKDFLRILNIIKSEK